MTTLIHPFDQALALNHSDLRSGLFTGATSPAYWNMVGPFGGATAALVLQAVLRHPELLGEPVAITVNFAAAIEAGEFEIQASPVRTNRSTQHWTVSIAQGGQVNTTATVFTALRRETWSESDLPAPEVPRPSDAEPIRIGPEGVAWLSQYEMRPISGKPPVVWDGGGSHSESLLWLRESPPRPLDFTALTAMSDMFFPRVWLRRATRVPAGTVSITTYLHADARVLAEVGTGYLLGRAQAQRFFNGYFDQSAQLWSESGRLLATSNQVVYYKE